MVLVDAFLIAVIAAGQMPDATGSLYQDCVLDSSGDRHPVAGVMFRRTTIEGFTNEFHDTTGLTFADLDGDGDQDAVAAQAAWHYLENRVSYLTVMLNDGDGVFGPQEVYWAGFEVTMTAAADFNGDGAIDLAATNASDDTVSVLYNNGDATFGVHVPHPVGTMPRSIVAADLDGDNDVDLAVLNVESDDLSLLLNEGEGTFASEVRVTAGNISERGKPNLTFPYPGPFIHAADIDADSDMDLIVPTKETVSILLNSGRGTFELSSAPSTGVGADAYDISIADLDDDGDLDLAVSTMGFDVSALSVIINDGPDGWAPPTVHQTILQTYHTGVAAGDVDSDGDLDLIVAAEKGDVLSLFTNDGTGIFAAAVPFNSREDAWRVYVVDLNGDGAEDLATVSAPIRSSMQIHLSVDGAIVTPKIVAPGGQIMNGAHRQTETIDFDLDGDLDIVSSTGQPWIEVIEGHGDGTFTHVPDFELDDPQSDARQMDIGDMDGDGLPDLILADQTDNAHDPGHIHVVRNFGDLQLALLSTYSFETGDPINVQVGDVDGDEDLDAVALLTEPSAGAKTPVNRRVVVLTNNGRGQLTPVSDMVVAAFVWQSAFAGLDLADFDGDGDLDVFAAVGPHEGPGEAIVLLNDGSGELTPFDAFETRPYPFRLVAHDFDQDDDQDIAIHYTNELQILANDGNAGFSLFDSKLDSNTVLLGIPHPIDMDLDGIMDIVLTHETGAMLVFSGRGNGTFKDSVAYASAYSLRSGSAGDLNGDGKPDLVGAPANKYGVSVLFNLLCDCPADINGDGELNVLDFVDFQLLWVKEARAADCDESQNFDVLDFICFQKQFLAGCE